MKKVLCFAAAALTLFAACQKTTVVYDNSEPQEIAVFAVNKTATKAPVASTSYPEDYDMAIAAYLAEGGTVGNYFPGTVFTRRNFAESPAEDYDWGGKDTPRYWPITTSTINFLAVAQPKEGYAGAGAVDITFNQTTFASAASVELTDNETVQAQNAAAGKYDQFDLMYAAGISHHDEGGNYNDVAMTFEHALSWINFKVASNVENLIKVNSIRLNGAYYDGILSLQNTEYDETNYTSGYTTKDAVTATWDVSGKNAVEGVYVPNDEATDNASASNQLTNTPVPFGNGLLVIPTEYTTGFPSFTINYTVENTQNVSNTFEYTYSFTQNPGWTAGNKYTYNITINLQEIKVNPSVTGWDDTDESVNPAESWGDDIDLN